MDSDASLRQHLLALLNARQAHVTFGDAIADIPLEVRGTRPDSVPYSAWELLEHIRIAQHDILDFCQNSDYTQPDWPDGYWPDTPAPPSDAAWEQSVRQVRADRQAMSDLVADPNTNLHAEIPHGDGQTVLREAMLVADHNAYHVGQLVTVRRLLGCWPPE